MDMTIAIAALHPHPQPFSHCDGRREPAMGQGFHSEPECPAAEKPDLPCQALRREGVDWQVAWQYVPQFSAGFRVHRGRWNCQVERGVRSLRASLARLRVSICLTAPGQRVKLKSEIALRCWARQALGP